MQDKNCYISQPLFMISIQIDESEEKLIEIYKSD